MAVKKPSNNAGKQRRSNAQNSAKTMPRPKRKAAPRGLPFQPGNPWRFPLGQSGNPGGRPRMLSETYTEWLNLTDEKTGLTNAHLVAASQGEQAILGETKAAREIRQATEGDLTRIVGMSDADLLKFIQDKLTADGSGDSGSEAPGPDPAA